MARLFETPDQVRTRIRQQSSQNVRGLGGLLGYMIGNRMSGGIGANPEVKRAEKIQGIVQQIGANYRDNPDPYKQMIETSKALMNAGEIDIASNLMQKAGQLQPATVGIKAKDIQPISKEVTSAIKPAMNIKSRAAQLQKLAKSGSTTDVVASAFMFMKTLDPTSTVRESEQGQVYSAEGKGAQLASFINSLTGDPRLDRDALQKLVNTAKRLANASIDETETNLTNLLGGYEGTPMDTAGYLKKQKARLPKKFNMNQAKDDPLGIR